MTKAHFGMIGLGTMGRNFLLNIAEHGISGVGFDLDAGKRELLLKEGAGMPVDVGSDMADFIAKLESPRNIMMLVPAGPIVDLVIADLLPHLEKNDLIIDGGNSHFTDTDRRIAELAKKDFDIVISPVGGGGLISGITLGLQRNDTTTQIFGAEPLLGNDASLSLEAGHIIANLTEPMTIADGARTISLGNLNWEIIKDNVAGIFEIPDEIIVEAVRLYFDLANLKCEPTGALSLGAILLNKTQCSGQKICVIVSGGNVDPAVYQNILDAN